MANLRLVNLAAVDSRTIKASFTHNLDLLINESNVIVESLIASIPNATVLEVKVIDNKLLITVMPMTPFADYLVTFKSTDSVLFRDVNGSAVVLEDGVTNVRQIKGPEEPENEIRDSLITLLSDNIYDLSRGTIVRSIINQIATNLLKARHDIGQAKNDNYLNVLTQDEKKTRGKGPSDRLNEEGAFEVLRVGKNPTNASLTGTLSFTTFPSDPISLLTITTANERLSAGNSDVAGTFDKLLLSLNHEPVTKVTRIFIQYQDGYTFTYPITSLGYQLKNSKYDPSFASTFVLLEDNQVTLNELVLEESDFIRIPVAGDFVYVDYEYKSLGRVVDESSVTVSQVLDIVREPAPALTDEFTTKHFPVVTSGGQVATSGGIQFLDPNSVTPFLTTHPAFTKEIPFRLESLPANPGEYSVDYSTGRVFVYGTTARREGTGNYPPAMTYKYRNTFRSTLDYTYDPETNDLVASPLRELATQTAVITFNYEQTLVPDVDFKAQVHNEVINERVENRLRTTNSLYTKNRPVTNVFRIFNETSGEIYGATRFNENYVYFSSVVPPKILEQKRERVSFETILNETLIVQEELENTLSVRIFKISLLNNRIMSITDDVVGSSYNSSVSFSKTNIFSVEKYFDGQVESLSNNLDRLLEAGQYEVDYRNGVIYVAVSNTQNFDIGSISYKAPIISPQNPHLISVSDIYYSTDFSLGATTKLNYVSFDEAEIVPSSFDISDERFLDGDETQQYLVVDGEIEVTNDVKTVRHIFDVYDLLNSDSPTDFADGATADGSSIILSSDGVEKREVLTVGAGLDLVVSTLSPGIEIGTAVSVIRVSDNQELLDGNETVSGNTITLSGFSGAVPGDIVIVLYTVVLNGVSTPIVDYDRGGYYIDYTYLADEILVSYEYGDNVIDFSESTAIDEGDTYYVTYRFGALRDSLLTNFGSLIDIEELQAFDTELSREIYRGALSGALQSFTKGPTIPAMSEIVSSVTKIAPKIIEAIFEVWSLGISYLNPDPITVHGSPSLVQGKYDQGIAIRESGEAVSFPVSSNLRVEEGTLEMWVIPDWNGLDNDANLTFSNLMLDGYGLASSDIYIGASSFNPIFTDENTFTLNKNDEESPIGLPSAIFTQIGLFIYYDSDNNIWKVLAKNRPTDGYDGYTYSGTIESSGEVYNVKFIEGLGEPDDTLRSFTNKIDFVLNIDAYEKDNQDGYSTTDGYVSGYSFDGFSFLADEEHYLFDFADEKDKNRFSLFKDGRGYLVFQVWDSGGRLPNKSTNRNRFEVSADIQSWLAGEKHHIAVGWKLNTQEHRDEMHLFIDGFEVPNIMRYGGRPIGTSSDRFRTVKPEYVVGLVPKNVIASNDLTTILGSNTVTSTSENFSAQGILVGDTLKILESGFSTYTITGVSGNSLTLSSTMPASLSDARFSVNPFSATVSTQLDLFKNIVVSVIRGSEEIEIPGLRADIPGYQLSKTAFNDNVITILGDVLAGDQVIIRTLGLNHRRCRTRAFLWGDQAVLRTHLPPPINLNEVKITPVLLPYYPIGPSNSTISLGHFVATGIQAYQPSSSTEGRTLEVRVTGGNVDFTTATTVTINGSTSGGPVTETLSFFSASSQNTTNKFTSISSVDVDTVPFTTTSNGLAIEIKEIYTVTRPNGNLVYPVIRFAFKTQIGNALEGTGTDVVTDANGFFPLSDVNNLLVITSPGSVAGTYTIFEKVDNTTIKVTPTPATSFTNGIYEIYNISIGRSGFQNGFFFTQQAGTANVPYELPQGYYEFDYAANLEVPFAPITQTAYIGSDYTLTKPAKAVIDEFRILSRLLTDTRVGESLAENEDSITVDYQSLRAFKKNSGTLMLLHFDELPFVNDSDFYRFATREYIQSGESVNSNFGQSIVLKNKGLSFENNGTLVTRHEGSIEFWVSPRFDTYNDPVVRFYFDATSSVVEEVTSLTKGTIKLSGRASQILSIRLESDIQNTGVEFSTRATLADDRQTINLKKALPFQQTPVKVAYIPSGTKGDRLSIFKDSSGFICFNVRANSLDYKVRTPVLWPRDTWHRISVTFKFNNADNNDQIRLFVDGEERGIITFGSNIIFGQGIVFGQTTVGVTNQILIADINFTDIANRYYIGTDYMGGFGAQARIDNLRISNVSRDPVLFGEQPIDVNYNSNTDTTFPVIEDAFTTFLLDFDGLVEKVDDFAILRDEKFGIFNFTVDVIDSFRILEDDRVMQILESMIRALKPANAKVNIQVTR